MPTAALNIVKSASKRTTIPRLFVLEINAGKIHVMNTDGSDRKTIVTGCHLPDGIVADTESGHIYWTNMGVPNLNDGSVERADLDGKNRTVIVPAGDTHTPKQIILDKKAGKLYWCDREGMRVMRCKLDGSQIETLVETGRGDEDRRDQTNGVSDSRSTRSTGISTGRKRAPTMPGLALSSAPMSKYPPGERRPTAPISKCSSAGCRSRSTSSSITRTASCTGPTAAIRRAATR